MQIGKHTVEFESPDLVCVIVEGSLTADDIRMICEFSTERRKEPHLFLLSDVTAMLRTSPEARKVASELGQRIPWRGTAIYGASFTVHTVLTLAITAANLLAKRDNPLRSFNNEHEARAWLRTRRNEVVAEQDRPSQRR